MASEEIALAVQVTGNHAELEGAAEMDVLVRVQTQVAGSRAPAHVCCVVDISGSMGERAVVKNANGQSESHGLTLLDITKHAVKTIGHTLNENDKLSLVKFDDRAEIVMEGVQMNDAGKEQLNTQLDTLQRRGQTNIWDGLFQGMECIRRSFEQEPHYYTAIMLLTDGVPNVRPPRGEITMLNNYQDQFPNMRCVVNTFGFGYNLDSKLLRDLASAGEGTFAFIPDPTIVGTAFVNMLSNSLATYATNFKVKVEPLNGAELKHVYGAKHTMTQWGAQIDMDSLNYGQSRDVVVSLAFPNGFEDGTNYLDATIEYIAQGSTGIDTCTHSLGSNTGNQEPTILMEKYRLLFCQIVTDAMNLVVKETTANNRRFDWSKLPEAQALIEDFISELENSDVASEQFIVDLLQDLTGQTREALSQKDYFQKWGVHYLPSLIGAHLKQECNNFKDPGVQHYGGALFKEIQDYADKKFLALPPPKPSANSNSGGRQRRTRGLGGNSASSPLNLLSGLSSTKSKFSSFRAITGNSAANTRMQSAAQYSMRSYHSSSNICFGGNGQVSMSDGSVKLIRNIKKGDCVLTETLETAVIECVIKTIINDTSPLVSLPTGLKITPYHPILRNGTWVFPIDVAPQMVRLEQCDAVYNFVLSNGHTMIINNVKTCTLGHGITTNACIAHPYFGTQKIVEDLQEMEGWSSGFITLGDNSLVRNEDTKLLEGFQPGCEILVSA